MDYGSAVRASKLRRLSSKHFGSDAFDISVLRSYYLCEDMRGADRNDIADELLKRSRKLVIDGVSFALPRQLKRLIYYEKIYKKDRYDESTQKWTTVYIYRPLQIYSLALARERERNSARFDGQLRQDSKRILDKIDYNSIHAAQAVENAFYESRVTIAEKRLELAKQGDSL